MPNIHGILTIGSETSIYEAILKTNNRAVSAIGGVPTAVSSFANDVSQTTTVNNQEVQKWTH